MPGSSEDPVEAEVPVSLLHLVDRTLGDQQRTANAKELIAAGGRQASRLVLAIGAAALAVSVPLGMLSGPGAAVGAAGATGVGLVWLVRGRFARR